MKDIIIRVKLRVLMVILLLILLISFGFTNLEAYSQTGVCYYDSKYYTQAIPDNYYNDVNLSLTGDSFKENLYNIIKVGHKRLSYEDVWTGIKKTEPIEGKADYVRCLYSGQEIYNIDNDNIKWNREHTWPKSHGFSSNVISNYAYTDMHHLRASEAVLNSTKNDYDFGDLTLGESNVKDAGYGNLYNSTLGIFEPRDEVKGDVARMIFYMETRYHFDSNVGITIVDKDTTNITSDDGSREIGKLSTLIKWNYEDPVSEDEIYRNNVVYEIQGNRNPYIDHPEYVDLAYPSQYKTENDENLVEYDQKIATFNILSTSSVSLGGTLPEGSTYAYSSTYSSKYQLTSGNSMTLTINGLDGCKVSAITLSMKSNTASGSGSYSCKVGNEVISEIKDNTFNSSNWNGAWSTTYVNVSPTVNNSERIVNSNESVTITISANANSLYCQSIKVDFLQPNDTQTPIVTPNPNQELIDSFKNVSIQSNLSLNYLPKEAKLPDETIIMSDVFSQKTDICGEIGQTKDNVLSNNITLQTIRGNKSASSNYNFDSKHVRIYRYDSFSFISNSYIDKVIIYCTENYHDISAVDTSKVSISKDTNDPSIVTVTNLEDSKRFDLTNVDTKSGLNGVRITSIKVIYKEIPNRDFSNMQMQFRYQFDFEKYQNAIEETGFILSDSSTYFNLLVNGSSASTVNGILSDKNNGNSKKIVKDSQTNSIDSFVYGINFTTLAHCNVKFYAIAYVIVGGEYYFSNTLNQSDGYSIKTLAQKYVNDNQIELSSDIKEVLSDFIKEIEGAQ